MHKLTLLWYNLRATLVDVLQPELRNEHRRQLETSAMREYNVYKELKELQAKYDALLKVEDDLETFLARLLDTVAEHSTYIAELKQTQRTLRELLSDARTAERSARRARDVWKLAAEQLHTRLEQTESTLEASSRLLNKQV